MSAPTLPELRATLQEAIVSYPELRRGLAGALAEIERVLEAPRTLTPAGERRDRRRVAGGEPYEPPRRAI